MAKGKGTPIVPEGQEITLEDLRAFFAGDWRAWAEVYIAVKQKADANDASADDE